MKRQISSDELNQFYGAIGEAVWRIQYLEHSLVSFVVMKRHKRKPTSLQKGYDRLEKERKGTLGSLYGRAKEEHIIPDRLISRFDKLVDERNWLMHDIRTENSDDLYNHSLWEKLMLKIKLIQQEAISLTKELMKELEKFMADEGFDINQAYKLAEEKIRTLKGTN